MAILTTAKLEEADKDADTLETVVNGADSIDVTSRLGRKYPSIAKAIKMVIETGGFEPFATEALLKASVPTLTKKAAKALDTKKVWLWDGVQWNDTGLSELDLAKEFAISRNALEVNRGNKTPFKFLSRNNISVEPTLDSTSLSWILNKILKVQVQNAREGKYYRIATIYRPSDTGYECKWIVEECDIANFATADTATRIIGNTHAQPTWVANSGIQTITLTPPATTHNDIRIVVTFDTSSLPGVFRATATSDSAYCYIIDPTFYEYKLAPTKTEVDTSIDTKVSANSATLNTLTLNSGKDTPLLNKTRNGINSTSHASLNNWLLSAKVLNAESDFYYRIAIFVNGSTALSGSNPEGWRIEKIKKDVYGTESETSTLVITNTDTPSQVLDRTVGGIQKLQLTSIRGAEVFELTIDTSKLAAYGTFMRSYLNTDPSYSFVIHPIYYEQAEATSMISEIKGIVYQYTASNKRITLEWQSGIAFYKQVFGVNGFNELPNFVSLSYKASASSEWVLVQSYASDVLPPLIIESQNNPTLENATSIYTGGNHGTSGGADGYKTATNDLYQIIVGGNAIDMSKNQSGIADSIKFNISNRLHAFNTIQTDAVTGRYVMQQNFMLDFRNGAWSITCFNKKLEPLTVNGDNGVQTFSTGFDTWIFLDGQYSSRIPVDTEQHSGLYSAYPNCWAMVLQGTGTQWVTWYDKSYGLGDGSQISNNAKRFRGGGASNTKIYAGAVSAKPLDMTGNVSTYKWRMGISIQALSLVKPIGADNTFALNNYGTVKNVIVYTATDYFSE